MVAAMLLRRLTWRGQGGPWASVLRVAAVLVVLLGIAASAWIARGWDAAVTRQRDERLHHSATSRTTAIGEMLREYESALYAERSLWLASAFVSHKDFETFASSLDPRRLPGVGIRHLQRLRLPAGRVAVRPAVHRRGTVRPGGRRRPDRRLPGGLPRRRPGRAYRLAHLGGRTFRLRYAPCPATRS
jgi:CHASE1-domain containing sensor protein